MTTAIVSFQERKSQLHAALTACKKTLIHSLAASHKNPQRFMAIAAHVVTADPKLMACSDATIMGAIIKCAQLGLEPDPVMGYAYLVPYKGRCTLIIGYKGLMQLVRRSGEITKVEARAVFEEDEFTYQFGSDAKIAHVPYRKEDRGDLTAAYAIAYWAPDSRGRPKASHAEVMERHEIDKIRDGSAAKNKGPWVTDYVEMAKKTVVRRLAKMLPSSTESPLQAAVALDDMGEAGIDQKLEQYAPLVEQGEPEAPKTLDDAAGLPKAGPPEVKAALDKLTDEDAGKILAKFEIAEDELAFSGEAKLRAILNACGDAMDHAEGSKPPKPGD